MLSPYAPPYVPRSQQVAARRRQVAYLGGAGAVGSAASSYLPTAYRAVAKYIKSSSKSNNNASQSTTIVKSTGQKKSRRGKVKSFPKKVKGQIKELKRLAEADMGTHIYRKRTTGRVLASESVVGNTDFSISTVTILEDALAGLKYYDPAAPGTLVTAAAATGTFQKDFYFPRIYAKLSARNNYQVPCNVKLYMCMPKRDTSISPKTAFTNGLTDVGGVSETSPLVYVTDSVEFQDLWKIVSTQSALLQPGDSLSISNSIKPFQYDPALVDNHNMTYQKKFGSMVVFVRIEGVLGHDSSVTTEQGTLQAGVDISTYLVAECRYPAGADIKQIVIADSADTFTNSGVASSKPLADNQSYSLA